MRKIILALSLCALVPMVLIAVANANDDKETAVVSDTVMDEAGTQEDSRHVVQRINCSDIKSEMDRLNSSTNLSSDDEKRLATLKSDYRSNCAVRSSKRANSVKKTMAGAQKGNDSEPESTCDNPDKNGCCPGETYTDMGDLGFNCCTENGAHCYPPISVPVAIIACDDGDKPNENGCCSGETYTDMGKDGFLCCKNDTGECFAPIKE